MVSHMAKKKKNVVYHFSGGFQSHPLLVYHDRVRVSSVAYLRYVDAWVIPDNNVRYERREQQCQLWRGRLDCAMK
jgi:hypothetical protein